MPNRLHDASAALMRGYALPFQLPDESWVAAAARQLPEPTSIMRDPLNPRDAATEILSTLERRLPMSRRHSRRAASLLWHPETQLARTRALGPVLEAISTSESQLAFRILAAHYARYFRRDLPGLGDVAASLRRMANGRSGDWSRLDQDYEVFDPDRGPDRLAAAVIAENQSVPDILRRYRLGTISAEGGYARAVTRSLLRALAEGAEPDHLRRLEKVMRYAMVEDRHPLFAEQLPDIADALLKPMVNTPVSDAVRDVYLGVVLRLFGDPRLGDRRWNGVPDAQRSIVTRWLTARSLRQFLEIVDQIALERMWVYRRAFWESVYDAGLISEAWVAFGIDGQRLARQSSMRGLQFAELYARGRQIEAGHAVLLMRIGPGVVADWSHNAKCNIWYSAADPTAPVLFQQSYGSNDLRIGDNTENRLQQGRVSLSHTSSDSFGWQGRVAEHIYQLTGQRLDRRRWRP